MRRLKVKRFLLGILLSLVLLVSVILPTKVEVVKANGTTKRIINVVMDTSGSMYNLKGQPQKKWCQAKYALQAFALMMDFENGDVLNIYPMHEISIGRGGTEHYGNDPWSGKKKNKAFLTIRNTDDVKKIADIYACTTQTKTPYSTVKTAHSDLEKIHENGIEKWLILLTDGQFTKPVPKGKSDADPEGTEENIRALANSDINVEYMLFGGEDDSEINEGKYHSIKRPSDSDDGDVIIKGVVDACNQVFNRDLLTSKQIKDNTIKCNLSWRKLIIFAQDAKVRIGDVVDSKTKESVNKTMDEIIEYSTLSRIKEDGEVDRRLKGQIASFENLKSGNQYNIIIEPSTLSKLVEDGKCIVCYEPDVEPKITLKDSKGNKAKKRIKPGKYSMDIELLDKQTGKTLDPNTIGNINFKNSEMTIKGIDGERKIKIIDSHTDDISIKNTDQSLDISLNGSYGKNVKYNLPPVKDVDKKIYVEQSLMMLVDKLQNYYSATGLEEGDGIDIKLAMNNRQLTDEEDSNTAPISIKSDKKDFKYSIEKKGKGYYRVKFKQKTDLGKHHLTITAKVDDSKITQKESIFVFSWLILILSILVIVAVLVLIVLLLLFIRKKRRQYMETLIGPENENDVRVDSKKTVYVYGNYEMGYSVNGTRFKTENDSYKPETPEQGIRQKYFNYDDRKYTYKVLSAAPPDRYSNSNKTKDINAELGVTLELEAWSQRGEQAKRGIIKRWIKNPNNERRLRVTDFKYRGPDPKEGKISIGSVQWEYLLKKNNRQIEEDGWYVNGSKDFYQYIKDKPIIIRNKSTIIVFGKRKNKNRTIDLQCRFTLKIK